MRRLRVVRRAGGVSGQHGKVCAVHGARGFSRLPGQNRVKDTALVFFRLINAYSTPAVAAEDWKVSDSRIPPRSGGRLVRRTVPQIERYESTRVVA
jgi:hypothetical protein